MFNKDFYPTPKEVIKTMLKGVDVKNLNVLEPSAGKGDILDYLRKEGAITYACEFDVDLAEIVVKKSDYFLAYDFLTLSSQDVLNMDLIVMNPPFSNADKHILHAYDIAPVGCKIIALCNSSTTDNLYSQNRKRLNSLIDSKEELGDCFSTAERKTNVNITLLRLTKKGEKHDNEFEGYFLSDDDDEDNSNTKEGLMPYDVIRDYVQRFIDLVKKFEGMKKIQDEINVLSEPFGSSIAFKLHTYQYCADEDYKVTKEVYLKSIQKSAWRSIIAKLKLEGTMTSASTDDLNRFIDNQMKFKFTEKNIRKMLETLYITRSNRFEKAIVSAFDDITYYHKENRSYVEGWKTNKNYMVGKKFIMPNMTQAFGAYGLGYQRTDIPDDICKSLCFLVGKNWDKECIPARDLFKNNSIGQHYGEWQDWNFFQIKPYQKATVHFKFKDDKVWELFNRKVAEIKGFVLPSKL